MNRSWTLVTLCILGLSACGDSSPKKLKSSTGIRQFKDRSDISETETLTSAHNLAGARIEARRTPVEIYVFKKPEFATYYKNREGYAFAIMLLVVDGELVTAAYTSTGDPTKKASRTVYVDGKKTLVPAKGVESPEGTFSIESIHKERTSNSFGDAMMNHAAFFYGGIAMHETGKENYGKLGRKASMGCIRLNRAAAKKVYEAILENADRNSKGNVYAYSKSTINVSQGGALKLFTEDEILDALQENFYEEQAMRAAAKP